MKTSAAASEAIPTTMKTGLSIVRSRRQRGPEPVLTIRTPTRIEATLALSKVAVCKGVMWGPATRSRGLANVGC